jgi:hypothetical protein
MNRSFVAATFLAALMALATAAGAQDKAGAEKPKPPDAKVLQAIFDAFAPGLPEKWDSAWVVVREVRQTGGARDYAVDCMYREPGGDIKGKPIRSCDRKIVFEKVYALNANIPDIKERQWTTAMLMYMPDGKFELKYGYEPVKEGVPASKGKEKDGKK